MTVDLKLMMDLRDLQVAMEVGKKAELGWFDVEFTMYGCTYQEKGSRYYRVSAYAEKIYDFIQSSAVNGVLPTDVAILSRRCPVPTGMRETIANDVKIELAAAMARQYPTGFFDYLERIAVEVAEETALPFLQEQMQQITGCFEQTKLQRLQTLAEDACLRRKISKISYQAICSWIAEEQKNIEDSPIPKDILEKTFYAIAYQSDGKLKYVVNACKEHIYQKKYALERQGVFVTPIFSETYYYNYTLRLPQVRQLFEENLHQYLDEALFGQLQHIYTHNHRFTAAEFREIEGHAVANYGPEAQQTLRHYGYRWGILGQ